MILSSQQMWGKACDKTECSSLKSYLGKRWFSLVLQGIFIGQRVQTSAIRWISSEI